MLAFLTLALLAIASYVRAEDGKNPVVFRSQTFVRTTGSPNSYTATFKVPGWVVAPFNMHVVNGDPDGRERVSSATVLLNNSQVLGPSDTSTLAGLSSGSFSYDADDRLSADTYDSNGNTIASGGLTNAYDFENHLVQHGGVTTKYLVDSLNPTGYAQVLQETISDGSSRTFVYGLGRISQRLVTPSTTLTSFYSYDGHGSVRALTDATGAVTDTYDYDAFGNLIHSSGSTPNEFLFAGEQFDSDLGLYYNRVRYLNTTTGRFWQADPFEGYLQDPVTLHKYYALKTNDSAGYGIEASIQLAKDDPDGAFDHADSYKFFAEESYQRSFNVTP